MVLICAGMSSGPSVSWRHPASSGASRSSAVVKSSSTVGSAFSCTVSDAEVWRMNSVTAPSRAPASFTNLATSAVRSTKPRPDVWTVRSEDMMVSALTVDDEERENDLGEVMNSVSRSYLRKQKPYSAASRFRTVGVDTLHKQSKAVIMGSGFRSEDPRSEEYASSNLAAEVLLHPVGHLDQPPPRALQKRHHAIHVAVAGQRDFDLALALGDLRLGLFQRVRLRQR